MNGSLTSGLEQYVDGKVRSGLYRSASEVIREGLRLLKERDELHQRRLDELKAEIREGIEQADRGQVSEFDEQALDRARDRGKERLADRGRGGGGGA